MKKITSKVLYIILIIMLASQVGLAQCPTVINTTQNFCNTQSATVADLVAVDNGGGVQWYSSATSTSPILPMTALTDGATYYADDNTGSCGARESVTVDIYAAPTGPSVQGFCVTSDSDPAHTLADLLVIGVNIKWYSASAGGTELPISTPLVNGQVYYASQTPPGTTCETTRLGVLIQLFDLTDAPVGSSEQFFCQDTSNPPTVADLVASGDNNWYSSDTAVVPLPSTTVLVDGVTYYSSVVVPPCESDARLPVTVTLYPENIAGANGGLIICEADLLSVGTVDLFAQLGGSPDAGGTWTGPLAITAGVVNVTSLTAGTSLTFTYTVQNSVNCPADTATVTILVPDDPDSGTPGTVTFCSDNPGEDLFNYLNGTPESGGSWTPALNSGTGVFDPSVDVAGVYTYTVVAPGNCSQSSTTVTVDVIFPPSSGVFTGLQSVCSNSGTFNLTTLLDGTQDPGGTWRNSSNTVVANPLNVSALTAGIYDYTYIVTNTCFTESTTVSVEIFNTPVSGVFTGSQDVCVTDGTFDLFNLLDGTQEAGGDWLDSSNTVVSNIVDISTFVQGTYNYSYSLTNFCGTSATNVSLNVFTPPSAGVSTGLQQNCDVSGFYDLNDLLDGTQTSGGTWTDINGVTISNPVNVSTFTAGTVFTYTYTVSNICGTDSEVVSVSFANSPDSGINGTTQFCADDAGADLFGSLGGTPDAGGVWSPALNSGTGFFDPAFDSAGVYTYTVLASGGCLVSSSTVTVDVLPLPNAGNFVGIQNICENATTFNLNSLLDGSQDGTGVWLDSSLNTLPGAVIDITGFSTGSYTYTYSVTNTCGTDTTDVSFVIEEVLSSGVFTGVQDVCNTSGTFDLFTLLDGSQDIGGSWTDSANNSVSATVDISLFTTGVYDFTYTVSNACGPISTTVSLDVSNAPNSGISSGVQESCTNVGFYDLFSLLDGSEDTGGEWLDSANNTVSNPLDVSGFTAGTYNFTYRVTNACGTATTVVSLFFADTPDAGSNGTISFCPADASVDLFTVLGGTPETGGSWSPALASGTGVFNPALDAGGTYTYTVTTATGCLQDSATVAVTILPLSNSGTFTGVQEVCASDGTFNLFSLLDGSQDTGGTWVDVANNAVPATINVSSFTSGTYQYTYTVANTCDSSSTSVSFTIADTPDPGVDGTAEFCLNGTSADLFSFLGGTPETGGTWSPALTSGSGIFDPAVDVAGVYTYAVSSAAGCLQETATVTVTVTNGVLNSGVFIGVQEVCTAMGTFDLFTLLDGSQDAGGDWLDSTNTIVTSTLDVSALTPGTYNYSYTITNICGTSTTDVSFTVADTPDAGFDGVLDICITDAGTDLFTFLGGTPDAGGIWTPSLDSNTGFFDPSVDAAGTYTYTVSSTGGCLQDNAVVNVTVSTGAPNSGTFTGSQEVCTIVGTFDLSDLLDGTEDLGGDWLNSSNNVVTNPVDVSSLNPGTYVFTYSVSNGCGISETSVDFIIPAEPNPGTDGAVSFCISDTGADLFTFLGGTPQPNGFWTPALTSGTGFFDPAVDTAGDYTYTVSSIGGCLQNTATVSVTLLNAAPNSGVFTGTQVFCNTGGNVDLFTLLDGSQETGGVWTDSGNNIVTNPIDVSSFTVGSSHTYTYGVSNACGSNTTTVDFSIEEPPASGVFTGVQDVCFTLGNFDLFTLLDGSQTAGGQWTDGASTPINNIIDLSTFSPGNFSFTYTVSSCGSSSTVVNINVFKDPNSGVFTGEQEVCVSGGTFDLTNLLNGAQDVTGVWLDSANNTVANPIDVSAFTPGTYNYTYEVTNPCSTATTAVSFTIADSPDSGTDASVSLCETDTAVDLFTFLGGTPETGGQWFFNTNPVSNIFDPAVDLAGDYSYVVTSTAGCVESTSVVSVTILTGAPSSGVFTGVEDACVASGTFDLFGLLDGSQQSGGDWMDLSNSVIANPVDLTTLGSGLHDFKYVVGNACGTNETTVQLHVLETITIDSNDVSGDSPLCFNEDATITISSMADGDYNLSYSLSGSNTQASQSVPLSISGGSGTFTISGTAELVNSGITTVSIDAIEYVGDVSCASIFIDVTVDIEVLEIPDVDPSQIAIDYICLGSDGFVEFTGVSLPDAVYEIQYTLLAASSNTYSATMTVAGGSGTLTIPAANLTEADVYMFTVDTITNLNDGCENLNVSTSVMFDVLPFPNIAVESTKLFADDVCLGSLNDITINNPSIPDGNYFITFEVTGVTTYTEVDVPVTFSNGEAIFTIAQGILDTTGNVNVLLVSLGDMAVQCPIFFTNIAQTNFEVYDGELPELIEEGNIFCIQDYPNPTLADLSAHIDNPIDIVQWFDSATGGVPLSETTPIEEGQVYYGAYEAYADCPLMTRLEVTIDIEFCDIIIPDGFSPNNDGANETFSIQNIREIYPLFTIEIFNRYGNIVYKGDFDTPDWDGKPNVGTTLGNGGVPTGVYFFVLKLNDGEAEPIQGRLYLNR